WAMKQSMLLVLSNSKTALLIAFISLLSKHASAEPTFVHAWCVDNVGNYTQNSSFQKNLDLVIADLTYQSSHSAFYNSTVGQGLNQAYGLYYCRGDLGFVGWQQCVQTTSTSILEKCPVEKEAIIWYEECTFRYANRSIFSIEEVYPWSWECSDGNVSNPDLFL
ncbi:hypothetical protein Ancab_005008, partial [Ancistrocladus abbreviatus]